MIIINWRKFIIKSKVIKIDMIKVVKTHLRSILNKNKIFLIWLLKTNLVPNRTYWNCSELGTAQPPLVLSLLSFNKKVCCLHAQLEPWLLVRVECVHYALPNAVTAINTVISLLSLFSGVYFSPRISLPRVLVNCWQMG